MPEVIHSQKDLRRDRNVKDQFGRLWLGAFEQTREGWAATELIVAGWDDPLRTPRAYLKRVKGEFGDIDAARIRVDVEAWIGDQRTAERDWTLRFYQLGRDHYKNRFDPKNPDVLKDDFLLQLTGPKPFPSVAALEQAFGLKNGRKPDPALLGLAPLQKAQRELLGIPEPEDYDQLAPTPSLDADGRPSVQRAADDTVPPDTYQEFVSWAMRTKQVTTLKDAAALWHAHKAALQEA